MQHWHAPDPNLADVPGEWRAEKGWPPENVTETNFFPQSDHTLSNTAPPADVHQLKYVPSIGVEAGFWWGELLQDTRPVDAFSLVYDSAPLKEDVAILGRAHALLRASATAPLANWFARLSDIAPDGSVTQVTGAGLNGAHRDSMSDPQDLEPGKFYPLNIEMHLTSWVFPKGHRIRLSIANALWPMILPTPYPMTTSLELGDSSGSRLVLPVVPVHGTEVPAFPPPETSEHRADIQSEGELWPGEWITERDEVHHKTTVRWRGQTQTMYPGGKESDYESLTYVTDDENPASTSVQGEARSVLELQGRVLTWQGHLSLTSDRKNFFYKYTRELLKDGKLIRSKTWQETIPRDHQ
jgi:hypothetical protein